MTAKKVILFAWSGQVGHELLKVLPTNYEIHVADIADGAPSVANRLASVSKIDLSDTSMTREYIAGIRPHLIINAAAYTAVDKAETDRDLAYKINAVAPGVLASEAAKIGSGLIHFSTDYVFDGSGDKPRSETDPTGPRNFYGETKLAGETAILAANAAALIFRTSWVVSSHGHNFVKTMLRFGAEREEMKVVADQIGAPTSAGLLARAVHRICSAESINDMLAYLEKCRGVYHLCCAGEVSWHGFALEIFAQAKQLGFPIKVERVIPIKTSEWPTPAQRPLNSRLSTEKYQRVFHEAPPAWQDELRKILGELR